MDCRAHAWRQRHQFEAAAISLERDKGLDQGCGKRCQEGIRFTHLQQLRAERSFGSNSF